MSEPKPEGNEAAAPTILVVDDDCAVRAALSDVLVEMNYAPVTAADGAEALDYLRGDNPLPCAIILDLRMPGMSGWEFSEIAKRDPELNGIPIVVSSSEPNPPACCTVVPKPIDVDRFTAAINKFCH